MISFYFGWLLFPFFRSEITIIYVRVFDLIGMLVIRFQSIYFWRSFRSPRPTGFLLCMFCYLNDSTFFSPLRLILPHSSIDLPHDKQSVVWKRDDACNQS